MISEAEASKTDLVQDQTDGNTSFLRAARDGNIEEVLDYLSGSTDINTSNPNGLNALHLASKEGHIDIVTELLNRGANVEAATKKGNTALHIASLAGHEEIVKLLVTKNAKVNVQAQTGFTPLYMAAQEGHSEVVKYLLANGASQSLSTVDGFTPLAVALQQGHERVVAVLLEHDTKGKVRLPALHIAAKKDDTKSAALLLQNEQNNVDLQTKSGFTPLHIASHYGNVNVGTLLIQRGADVNFKAKNNITPLHVAGRWGKNSMITLLLDNKATIDEKTRDGLTPLHCAARSGHENVVDTLLIRGAPYQAKTKNGLTPLHMAAQGDHVDCARLLLYHKAPVDDVTMDYLTPLHVGAHCGNVNTAKLLLDRKCDANSRALNGFTPLHIACKKNRIKVVELLLKYGASIEATTESGLSPLHVASFMGHMNIVIYLIQHDAKPDYPTVRGETALHLAARAQQTDIIRILLRNGATVDARAREQQTPLHIAARLGNVDNVVLLLQHGAKPDATTKDLYTPLHIASKEGHEEVASVLLDHEANLNLTTKKGFTPLHIAAKYGQLKVAKLLLQKDANPDVQGKNGLTPLHVATHYNHVSVALLLLNNKASPHSTAKNGYTPLHIAAKKNQMDIATTLLEYSANPDAESKNGFTPIHLAAQEGHTDMVSLLLEHKANVNCKSNNGLTPMHLAAQEDKVPVAEVLVKYGSNIDPQTKAGYTPLHTACHFGQTNMVRYLLEHEASVNATTKLGYTPLHQAAQQGQVIVCNLLLKHKASPNAVTNNGQTALSIAERLGYISVVDTLKGITEVTDTVPAGEDKYKVVSPETMQEAFLSDSEDEGGEDSLSDRGGSQSPLDTSYDKDVVMRFPGQAEHSGRRMKNEISTALYYPSYLEKGPDYEAEMRYFSGDTLSPQEKEKRVLSGDYSTMGSSDYSTLDSEGPRKPIRSVDASMNSLDADDYATDDLMKKDYMEAQMIGSYEAPIQAVQADNRYAAPPKSEGNRYGSYSGSSFNTHFDPDNVTIDKTPVYSGKLKWKSFLVSFMVDARGGAMRGTRHSGIRIVIPPGKAAMPTRILCRLIKKEKLLHPPVLNEGEALANRIIEMGPHGTKFLGPVLIEVPHYASLRDKEREIQILRSDNGDTWYEHPMVATEDAVAQAMAGTFEGGKPIDSMLKFEGEDDLSAKRITRILTADLPQYFALVTRVRAENQSIGEGGGVISSKVVPQVQAVFPEGALKKNIRVGLQAQPISPETITKLFGNRVACSPIVTLEPRRRKFHKAITITIPVPKAAQKGMINQYQNENPSLRLLCSITGGANGAVWEDITENKNLTYTNGCVSFITTVSARFWLMDCQATQEAASMATEIYHEAVTVPYMARFVVFAKRTAMEEGQLRMFCMTDDKIDKTLEKQQHFVEVARSRDVEVLEGRPQFIEMAGNLIPVTKSGDQLFIDFKAFRENRLPSTVRIRDQDQEPAARVAFMKEPKVARGEAPQIPICNLNITMPGWSKSSSMELQADDSLEVRKRHSLLREHGIVLSDSISRAQIKLTDVADTLQGDWVILAHQLDITGPEINQIKTDYNTVNDQALAMLQLWVEKKGEEATGNALENGLRQVGREDVIKKTMYNVEVAEDELEAAAARAAMDQSGFDNFAEEVGISQDSSLKKGMSLDVEYDEKDMVKESESANEESSEDDKKDIRLAPQAPVEGYTDTNLDDIIAEVDERRKVATTTESTAPMSENKKQAYLDLITALDDYEDQRDRHLDKQEELDDSGPVGEDTFVKEQKQQEEQVFARLEAFGVQAELKQAPSVPVDELVTKATKSPEEDEEGARTPPPSPEEQFVQEDTSRETAVDQLAARLSEPKEVPTQEEEADKTDFGTGRYDDKRSLDIKKQTDLVANEDTIESKSSESPQVPLLKEEQKQCTPLNTSEIIQASSTIELKISSEYTKTLEREFIDNKTEDPGKGSIKQIPSPRDDEEYFDTVENLSDDEKVTYRNKDIKPLQNEPKRKIKEPKRVTFASSVVDNERLESDSSTGSDTDSSDSSYDTSDEETEGFYEVTSAYADTKHSGQKSFISPNYEKNSDDNRLADKIITTDIDDYSDEMNYGNIASKPTVSPIKTVLDSKTESVVHEEKEYFISPDNGFIQKEMDVKKEDSNNAVGNEEEQPVDEDKREPKIKFYPVINLEQMAFHHDENGRFSNELTEKYEMGLVETDNDDGTLILVKSEPRKEKDSVEESQALAEEADEIENYPAVTDNIHLEVQPGKDDEAKAKHALMNKPIRTKMSEDGGYIFENILHEKSDGIVSEMEDQMGLDDFIYNKNQVVNNKQARATPVDILSSKPDGKPSDIIFDRFNSDKSKDESKLGNDADLMQRLDSCAEEEICKTKKSNNDVVGLDIGLIQHSIKKDNAGLKAATNEDSGASNFKKDPFEENLDTEFIYQGESCSETEPELFEIANDLQLLNKDAPMDSSLKIQTTSDLDSDRNENFITKSEEATNKTVGRSHDGYHKADTKSNMESIIRRQTDELPPVNIESNKDTCITIIQDNQVGQISKVLSEEKATETKARETKHDIYTSVSKDVTQFINESIETDIDEGMIYEGGTSNKTKSESDGKYAKDIPQNGKEFVEINVFSEEQNVFPLKDPQTIKEVTEQPLATESGNIETFIKNLDDDFFEEDDDYGTDLDAVYIKENLKKDSFTKDIAMSPSNSNLGSVSRPDNQEVSMKEKGNNSPTALQGQSLPVSAEVGDQEMQDKNNREIFKFENKTNGTRPTGFIQPKTLEVDNEEASRIQQSSDEPGYIFTPHLELKTVETDLDVVFKESPNDVVEPHRETEIERTESFIDNIGPILWKKDPRDFADQSPILSKEETKSLSNIIVSGYPAKSDVREIPLDSYTVEQKEIPNKFQTTLDSNDTYMDSRTNSIRNDNGEIYISDIGANRPEYVLPEYIEEKIHSAIPVESPPGHKGPLPDEVYCETSLTVVRRVKVKQRYQTNRTERQPTTYIEKAILKKDQPGIDKQVVESRKHKRSRSSSSSDSETHGSRAKKLEADYITKKEYQADPPAREFILQVPSVDGKVERFAEKYVKEEQYAPSRSPSTVSNAGDSDMETKMLDVDEGEVFDPNMQEGESYYEDTKPDGSIIKKKRIKHLPRGHVSFDQTEDVEFLEEAGPVRVETDVQDEEEILEDGTIHKIHKVKKHALRHIRKSLRSDAGEEDVVEEADIEVPGSEKERIVETFEGKPQKVMQVEEEEETLDDGTTVKRQVIMSSMVQKIKQRTRSFDDGVLEEREEEIDEVIPGTQSCFIARSDSSSSSSFIDDLDELEAVLEEETETLEDGTKIQTTLLQATEKRKARSRSGSIERSEDVVLVKERRITPSPSPAPSPPHSPRSGSPVHMEDLASQIAHKIVRSAHLEAKIHKTETSIEETAQLTTDELIPPGSSAALLEEEAEDEDDLLDTAEGGDTQTTRITMKKEIHTKTVLKDGEEQTFVHEDTQVEQDPNAPEELRESMQQIIDEFMGSPTEAQRKLEDDV